MNPENVRSVADAIAWAAHVFREAGVDSPRRAAELLLAHVLGWNRTQLITLVFEPLGAEALARYEHLVRRHAAGEPLQYLTGEREFFGLLFHVAPPVLIPRPETEILVEKAVQLARSYSTSARFVDVGTGSGCIAIALAHEVPASHGWAIDLSGAALAMARENARRIGVLDRIEFVCCDLLEALAPLPVFDLILSNPPYIAGAEIENLAAGVREYEPRLALFGGESGTELYRRLIPSSAVRLAPGGWLLLEIGMGQDPEVRDLLRQHEFTVEEALPDLQGISRCLVARRREI